MGVTAREAAGDDTAKLHANTQSQNEEVARMFIPIERAHPEQMTECHGRVIAVCVYATKES